MERKDEERIIENYFKATIGEELFEILKAKGILRRLLKLKEEQINQKFIHFLKPVEQHLHDQYELKNSLEFFNSWQYVVKKIERLEETNKNDRTKS